VPEDGEIVARTGRRDEEQGPVTHAFTLIAIGVAVLKLRDGTARDEPVAYPGDD
jgi:hypothetical protein